MPTYKAHIYGDRNYRSQEIKIDGVNSASAALDVARARYPGANIKAAQIIDNCDIGQREAANERDAQRREAGRAQTQRANDLEDNIKSQAGGGSGVVSPSYNNTNSGGSEVSSTDIMGLLFIGAIGFGLWIAWFIIPFLLPFAGIFFGYKYASKWSVNLHFQLRMWLVIMSTIGMATVGGLAFPKIQELQRNEALPEFMRLPPAVESPAS
jgi:hypothetical protein